MQDILEPLVLDNSIASVNSKCQHLPPKANLWGTFGGNQKPCPSWDKIYQEKVPTPGNILDLVSLSC